MCFRQLQVAQASLSNIFAWETTQSQKIKEKGETQTGFHTGQFCQASLANTVFWEITAFFFFFF